MNIDCSSYKSVSISHDIIRDALYLLKWVSHHYSRLKTAVHMWLSIYIYIYFIYSVDLDLDILWRGRLQSALTADVPLTKPRLRKPYDRELCHFNVNVDIFIYVNLDVFE